MLIVSVSNIGCWIWSNRVDICLSLWVFPDDFVVVYCSLTDQVFEVLISSVCKERFGILKCFRVDFKDIPMFVDG